jgi:hypothetical protein
LNDQSFGFGGSVPGWLAGCLGEESGADVGIAPGRGLLKTLLDGQRIDKQAYLDELARFDALMPGTLNQLTRGVAGLALPGREPAISNFGGYFDQLEPWIMADGSPVDGNDLLHRRRLSLGFWSLLLSDAHDVELSGDWRHKLSAAAYYLLVRFAGHRKSAGTEWEAWASIVDAVEPLMLASLPFDAQVTPSSWGGFRRVSIAQHSPVAWKTIAFREGGVCVLCGEGLYAVGSPGGCELSDGAGPVAWIRTDSEVNRWRLDSARSSESKAGFRLIRHEEERLIVSGRHGRILLISEALGCRHQLSVELAHGMRDLGPRRLGNDAVSLEMDRSAAWSGVGRLWTGCRVGDSSPVRLRVALSRNLQ